MYGGWCIINFNRGTTNLRLLYTHEPQDNELVYSCDVIPHVNLFRQNPQSLTIASSDFNSNTISVYKYDGCKKWYLCFMIFFCVHSLLRSVTLKGNHEFYLCRDLICQIGWNKDSILLAILLILRTLNLPDPPESGF